MNRFRIVHLMLFFSLNVSHAVIVVPNDPLLNDQHYLFLERGGIGAPEAWVLAGGIDALEEVVVAIVSSGIMTTHEDLQNQLWVNEDEIPGNGIDDDQNGYTDDVHGWNFAKHSGDIEDRFGEGTFLAGIIAAEANNGVGIAGIAPNARIMSLVTIRNPSADFIGGGGYSSGGLTYEMIQYAISEGADIIVYPELFSSTKPTELDDLPTEFVASGILYIEPQIFGQEITTTTNSPQIFNFLETSLNRLSADNHLYLETMEDFYRLVEAAVPGQDCLSTYIMDTADYASHGFHASSGIMAGVLALVKGAHPDDDPSMLMTRIIDGADPESLLEGLVASGGWIDASSAVGLDPDRRIQTLSAQGLRDLNIEERRINLDITSSGGLQPELTLLYGPVVLDDGNIVMTGETGDVAIRVSQSGNAAYRPAEAINLEFRINPSVDILQAENRHDFSYSDPFQIHHGEHADIEGGIMVRARYWPDLPYDNRAAEIRKRVGDQWEVIGFLELPEADVPLFPRVGNRAVVISGNLIAVWLRAVSQEGADPLLRHAIYLYEVEDLNNGIFNLVQVIRPPELAGSFWGYRLQLNGNWLAFAFDDNGSRCRLMRRNEEGLFEDIPMWNDVNAYELVLTESRLIWRSPGVGHPIEIYETKNHPEPLHVSSLRFDFFDPNIIANDEWLALGENFNSDRFSRAGAVHLYKWDGLGEYIYHQTLYPDDATTNLGFGRNYYQSHVMDLENDLFVVSAPRLNDRHKAVEEQYVYQLDEETGYWKARYRTRAPASLLSNPLRTFSVALDGEWLTCYNSQHLLTFDLGNPRKAEPHFYLVEGQEQAFVDSDPIDIDFITSGAGEVVFSILSGPGTIERSTVIPTGEVGDIVVEAQQRET